MSITNKLNYLRETKELIKQAIIDKGVSVEDTDNFRSYYTKILAISGADPRNYLDPADKNIAKYFEYNIEGDYSFYNVDKINYAAWYADFGNYDIVIPYSIGPNNENTVYNNCLFQGYTGIAINLANTGHSYTIDRNAKFFNNAIYLSGNHNLTNSFDIPDTVTYFTSGQNISSSSKKIVINTGKNLQSLSWYGSFPYAINFNKSKNLSDIGDLFEIPAYYIFGTGMTGVNTFDLSSTEADLSMYSTFYKCIDFNQPVLFPDKVSDLRYCFMYCNNYALPIVLPNNGTYANLCHTFSDCHYLPSITIPENNSKIYNFALMCDNASRLKNIYMSNNIKISPTLDGAFNNCPSLKLDNLSFVQYATSLYRSFYICSSMNFNTIVFNDNIIEMEDCFAHSNFNIPILFNEMKSLQNINSAFCNSKMNSEINLYNTELTSVYNMLSNCHNFNNKIILPKNVEDISFLFKNANEFNQPIVLPSTIQNMHNAFSAAHNFNQDIHLENLTKLEDISGAIEYQMKFNHPLNFNCRNTLWSIASLVKSSRNFNQPINLSEYKNLTNAAEAFKYCNHLNQDINFYNCSGLTNILSIMDSCYNFNSNLNFDGCSNVRKTYDYIGRNSYYAFGAMTGYNKPFNFQCFQNLECGDYFALRWSNFNHPVNFSNLKELKSLNYAFMHCYNLNSDIILNDCPKLKSISHMLYNCSSFNTNIYFNNSFITDLDHTFYNSGFNQPFNFDNLPYLDYVNNSFSSSKFNQDISFTNHNFLNKIENTFINCSDFNKTVTIKNLPILQSLYQAFFKCKIFNNAIIIENCPILNMSRTFAYCTKFNQYINYQNIPTIQSMWESYENCLEFNQPLNFANTKLNNAYSMMENCISFNSPVNFSNTTQLQALEYTFNNCSILGSEINIENSSITKLRGTFMNCTFGNFKINISNCTNLFHAFHNCQAFNQPLNFSNKLINIDNAFYRCVSLNQNIVLPTSLKTISNYSFQDVPGDIYIPNTVTSIGVRAFTGARIIHYNGSLTSSNNWGAFSRDTGEWPEEFRI